jgi:hypothetical protein
MLRQKLDSVSRDRAKPHPFGARYARPIRLNGGLSLSRLPYFLYCLRSLARFYLA